MCPLYVITVNFNSLGYMRGLVESLAHVPEVTRLIVVDHSHELCDDSLVAEFPIQIIHQENKGYGAGLNRGLREIRDTDALVLLCNPDIRVLTPERFGHVAQYMNSHPKIGALSPRILIQDGATVSSCRQFYNLSTILAVRCNWLVRKKPKFIEEHYYWNKGFDNPYVGDWASGAALFCRLSAFPDRVFFDERFFLYFEDVDFSARLWKRGWSVEYFPEFVVEHHEARRSRKNPFFLFRHVASLMKFVWKHKGFPTRDSLVKSRELANKKANALETAKGCAITSIER